MECQHENTRTSRCAGLTSLDKCGINFTSFYYTSIVLLCEHRGILVELFTSFVTTLLLWQGVKSNTKIF